MRRFIQRLYDWLIEIFSTEEPPLSRDNTRLQNMIQDHEGLRLSLYKCSAGKLTIGVGRNIEDRGIRHDEAELMLKNDIAEAIEECGRFDWFAKLNEARQDAIVDMMFNLGLTRFAGFRKTIAHLEAEEYELAAEEMLRSRWAEQVGRRAQYVSEIIRLGHYPEQSSG